METTKTQNKSTFLQISMGISMMLVAASLFVLSVNHVSASSPDKFPTPNEFMMQGGGKIGKYTCTSSASGGGKNSSGQQVAPFSSLTIMDTETGKTVGYSADADGGWKWVKDASQLPANPLQ